MTLLNLRNRHFFLADLSFLALAAYASFVLRLETFLLGKYLVTSVLFAVTAMLIFPVLFRTTGLYSLYWRYASVEELLWLSTVTVVGVVIASLATWAIAFVTPLPALPRSIPFIFLLLVLPAMAMPRLGARMLHQMRYRRYGSTSHKRVLIVGAGDAGAMILRELQRNPQLRLEVVGFVDDDPAKHAIRLRGIPVLGDRNDIITLVPRHAIEQVIIAMPTAPGKVIREIVDICEKVDVETKIIPGIYELLDGTVSLNQLRDVDIEDLLRRTPVQTDVEAVATLIQGKRVLLTGGGGSIGSELCRQIYRSGPSELVLLGHGENSIFTIYQELKALVNPEIRLSAVIADIRFPERIQAIFEKHRPEIVFHAAAHKHVPLMEANPAEAVTNNILGTRSLLAAARSVGVEQFVMISTDKAVNPTSLMGASKRVAELLVQHAAQETGRPYVTVRFGNVLGSRGSVVITFKRQIARGGPVTVTHPEMRRYFMTIPEAVQLVLQAAVLGGGGEVFLLDMGEPVKIADLARDLIELSGLRVGTDIELIYTGIRPGEKLFEEMFVEGETYHRTEHEKIFVAENDGARVPDQLSLLTDALADAARRNSRVEIVTFLQKLVPEYQPVEKAKPGDLSRSDGTHFRQTGELVVDGE